MLLIPLNKASKEPLYKQIVHKISHMIESGKLKEDEVLPSTRQLADTLQVSRQTVVQAYEELWALGYLKSSSGSYTKVRKRPSTAQKENRANPKIDFSNLVGAEKSRQLKEMSKRYESLEQTERKLIDMSVMNLDSSIFPLKAFQKSMNKVFREYPKSTLNYGQTAGYGKLRKWISNRMLQHSIDVYPDEVILTNGISHGFELILKLFTSPGDTVITESPGYRIAINLMKMHQLNIVEIPLKAEGPDLEIFDRELRRCRGEGVKPKLFYTVPTFQNPTGIITSQEHRERLLSLCTAYNIPIIEDSFEEEITYFDKKILPVKSMDKEQIVFYLGTFSKVLFPGIRVGWIAGEQDCIRQINIIKKMSYMSDNTLTHTALYEFCNNGNYETFLKKVNRYYGQKMEKAISLMQRNLTMEECHWNTPAGGYLFWVKIDRSFEKESVFLNTCEKNGIKVSGGSEFFLSKPDAIYFRICISSLSDKELENGILLLGRSIRDFLKGD